MMDEQSLDVVKPDIYVENDYLVFKDYAALDSLKDLLQSKSVDFTYEFNSRLGFTSAFSHQQKLMEDFEKLSDEDGIKYLEVYSNNGYFNAQKKEFSFPFHNETWAVVLNPSGKVKIGNVYYQFEGKTQTVYPDLRNTKFEGEEDEFKITSNHDEPSNDLKSASIIFDQTTSGGQQRLTMRVLREKFDIYERNEQGYLMLVRVYWEYHLRFHSWRQRRFSKSDKNTYFHWQHFQFNIGGNNGFDHEEWYTGLYTETSPWKAIYYKEIYTSNEVNHTITNPPNLTRLYCYCWSDRLPNPTNFIQIH